MFCKTIIVFLCLFVAAVKSRFENIRCPYRKYKTQKNKAAALGKSGFGWTISKLQIPYKYAAEAAFLVVVMKCEPTIESMDSPGTSSSEVGYCYCTMHISIETDNNTKIYNINKVMSRYAMHQHCFIL